MESIVKGYVLRKVQYKEADAIVTILTEKNEIMAFKARAIDKQNSKHAASCQLFSFSEFLLDFKSEYGNKTLRSGKIQELPNVIFENIQCGVLLNLLSELILRFEDQSTEGAFRLFQALMNQLKSSFDFITLTLIILKYGLLWSGMLLEVDRCVLCGTQKKISTLSFQEGGYLCFECALQSNVPPKSVEYIKNIRYVIKSTYLNFADFKVQDTAGYAIFQDFCAFLANNAGIYLKSKEMIETLLKL